MARTKSRTISIIESKGTFSLFKKGKTAKDEYEFSDLLALRQLLTKEKARILHVIKTENPPSIYALAKTLGRGFKAVNDDVKLLERFGFLDLIEEKTKRRKRLRPEVVIDSLTITIDL